MKTLINMLRREVKVGLFDILRKVILFHYINVDIAHVTKFEINEFHANMVEYYQFSISAMKMQKY
jgi:hypothetical protein